MQVGIGKCNIVGIEFHGSLVHSYGDGQQAADPLILLKERLPRTSQRRNNCVVTSVVSVWI